MITACRDDTKGKTAVDKIKKASKNEKVEYIQLDLNSLTSVRQFASEFRKKNLPLHLLVNNAGMNSILSTISYVPSGIMNLPKRTETADGFEAQFGVNHLGHFLLTNLLLDILKSSAPARIVNVSSSMHYGGDIRWDDIGYKNSYNPVQSNSNSKVANVLFTNELAKRLEGTGVVVNSIHPGSVDTELTRYNEFPGQHTVKKMICKRFFRNSVIDEFYLVRTPYEGALTQIWVAVAPEAEKVTGKFWSDCGIVDSSSLSNDEKAQSKLWDLSAKLVNLK